MTIRGRDISSEQLAKLCAEHQLAPDELPQHVAIIMDGNGRWAAQRKKPRVFGHKQGAESLRSVIKACVEFNIKYLSVYAFSTENWRRPTDEVRFLMDFFVRLLNKEAHEMHRQGIRIRVLGDLSALASDLVEKIQWAESKTLANSVLQLNILLNYGSRHDILQAAQRLVSDVQSGYVSEPITESVFSEYLYTNGIPDPDVLIRPGGENRLSNFMLWQLAYSELIFTEILWPDFDRDRLISMLQIYQQRHRRYGGL